MPVRIRISLALALLAGAPPAMAQLGPPLIGGAIDRVANAVGGVVEPLARTAGSLIGDAATLAQARVERLAERVRRNRSTIERDATGAPARKGELLLLDPGEADLAAAREAGFTPLGRERLGDLGIAIERLATPARLSLARSEQLLRARLPQATIAADTLHEPAGQASAGAARPAPEGNEPPVPPIATPVGLIDGGVGAGLAPAAAKGFASGAPRPSDHGSAVASLLAGAGVREIHAADVYGADPAGGNALAIARALDWLTGSGVRVVSISLVGPDNPVVRRAVAAARQRGMVIVAAVGNDGPAAPPAFPASYPGVLAVTGVDGANRALIEAGRALHLDYAAPGADLVARDARGRRQWVRGTSYATPLVAARAAAALPAGNLVATLDREARPLGSPALYGRGLLCGGCRRSR